PVSAAGKDVSPGMRSKLVGPVALPGHVVAEKVELADAAASEIADDLVDQEMAEPILRERGIEARLEEEIDAVVDERKVKGDAAIAGAQEIDRQLLSRGVGVRDLRVAAAQILVAGDGGPALALPAGGLEGEAFVERALQPIMGIDALERD